MDVKDIIKWLLSQKIPDSRKQENRIVKMTVCVLVFSNALVSCMAASDNYDNSVNNSVVYNFKSNHSTFVVENKSFKTNHEVVSEKVRSLMYATTKYIRDRLKNFEERGVSRTFGRPIKRLQAALLPVMFKLGVISTLIFLTFLMVVKGVAIGMMLLMFKFAAGLAKVKSLLHEPHHHYEQGWAPPQRKEVHVHVHSNHAQGHHGYGHDVLGSILGSGHSWNRQDSSLSTLVDNYMDRYNSVPQGPVSINTPYGHYIRVGDPTAPSMYLN